MAHTTLSSREFNHDTGRAKKSTANGPVFITDRGRPSHVLLSIEEYQRLIAQDQAITDPLGQPAGVEDIEISFPRSRDLAQGADFS